MLEFESGYAPSAATAIVVDRTMANRVKRAFLSMGVCVFLALVSVFIPLMHFILPPTFLITGVVLAITRLREETSLVEVRGNCPRCKIEKVFPAQGRFVDKRTLRCSQCAEQMKLLVSAPS